MKHILTQTPSIQVHSNTAQVDVLTINNSQAVAKISLYGGHVLSFQPKHDQRERLWLSSDTLLDGSRAIRGGIPVCWPWFGSHSSADFQSHGYVRNQTWHVIHSSENAQSTKIHLSPENANAPGFTGQAKLTLIITIGSQLSIELITENIGNEPFPLTCALHSYFNVNDVRHTELFGITGDYSDKTANWDIFNTPKPYLFSEETDRIHLNPATQVTISCNQQETQIFSEGHDSLVVWNPWQDVSAKMSDMSKNGFLTMLCVETAITQGITLLPAEKHSMKQSF